MTLPKQVVPPWIGSSFRGINDPMQAVASTQFRTEKRFPLFLELPWARSIARPCGGGQRSNAASIGTR
jgi:hypothetical protein